METIVRGLFNGAAPKNKNKVMDPARKTVVGV